MRQSIGISSGSNEWETLQFNVIEVEKLQIYDGKFFTLELKMREKC